MSAQDWKAYELIVTRANPEELGPKVESPKDLVKYFSGVANNDLQESLFVISFNGRNDVIGITRAVQGTATGTSVAIGELMRPALLTGAVAVALVHNHPSGDHQPSDEDIRLTKEIVSAGRILDITILDHLVVSHTGFTSIRSMKPSMWSVEQDWEGDNV